MSAIHPPVSAVPSAVVAEPERRRRAAAFWVVAAVLVVAAVGLNVLIPELKIIIRKLPVEPAEPLKMIRGDLGPWAQVSVDRALDADMEHELGAQQYLMRTYVDTRVLDPKDRAAMLSAPIDEREKMVGRLGRLDDKAVVHFMLTYYTGSADTVPHVPDRCYVADGFLPSPDGVRVVHWPVLPRTNAADRSVGVRLIDFEDQIDSRQSRPCQVSYFFQVNGAYEYDPIIGVRKRLQSLFDKHAYFAKIELRTDTAPAAAQGVMTDFLQNAMPDIERVLPDWSKVSN